MVFDIENTIFFDTKSPLHKETIEKSIDDKNIVFQCLHFFDISERSGQAFIELSIEDVTTPGIIAHNK